MSQKSSPAFQLPSIPSGPGLDKDAELKKLRKLVNEAPTFFAPQYDFEGEKLRWLQEAGLAPVVPA